MKYTKPELVVLNVALEAIRGGKGMPVQYDAPLHPRDFTQSINAYEADE
jgi:hypothetical protein